MPSRDELIEEAVAFFDCPRPGAAFFVANLLARWPHIAGPERVETVEELRELPQGAVIRDVRTARTAYRLTIRAMEGEIAENDGVIRTLRHQRDDAEAALDRVRAMHDQYLPAAVDYDCCGHCNIGGNYVPWPCPTIRALDGEV